ncbi:MAG: oligopeptidase B, partial [Marinoscillum sp.]
MTSTQPYVLLFSVMLYVACSGETSNRTKEEMSMQPPIAEKQPYELTGHGDVRVDNYYWMRLSDEQKLAAEPDEQTQKVLDYLGGENKYTSEALKSTETLQETLYQEMVGRISQNDESVPYLSHGYYYYSRYEEGMEYPIYCRKKGSLSSKEQVILDVNQLAEGQEFYNVAGLRVSPDNKLLAFGEDTLSRRIYTIRILNLETGQFLEDEIPFAEAGVAWAADNQTLFYTAKNRVSLLSEEIKKHTLGTSTDTDQTVYKEEDPSYYIGCYQSKSGEYIIIWNSSTLSTDHYILKSDNPNGAFRQFTPREGVHEYSIEHFEDKFYVVTNWDATNFRLMEVNECNTEKSHGKEVIPHREDVLLSSIEVFKNFLVVEERKDGLNQLRVINQKSKEDYYIPMDEVAYKAGIDTNKDFETNTLRFYYSSLATPETVYDF